MAYKKQIMCLDPFKTYIVLKSLKIMFNKVIIKLNVFQKHILFIGQASFLTTEEFVKELEFLSTAKQHFRPLNHKRLLIRQCRKERSKDHEMYSDSELM